MSGTAHLAPGQASRLIAYLPLPEREPLRHALACGACRECLQRGLVDAPSLATSDLRLPPEYAEVIDRIQAGLQEATERMSAERVQAEAAVAGLLAAPAEIRRRRIRRETRLRTLPVAALLLERTLALLSAAPEEAENLALLALYVLGQLDPEGAPSAVVGELKVRAWALVAGACWQSADWLAVREALEHAEEVMVIEGHTTKRVGFRRAVAALRLAERQVEEALGAAAGALTLLLGPLLGEVEPLPEN